MDYQAVAKYIRMSPRKVQLVARSVHRLTPTLALARLQAIPKRAGGPLADVIASAMAGAKEKKADTAVLKIKSIEVLPGPATKRWHAVSKGQAHAYKKRMTHIRIVLTDDEIKNQKSKIKNTK